MDGVCTYKSRSIAPKKETPLVYFQVVGPTTSIFVCYILTWFPNPRQQEHAFLGYARPGAQTAAFTTSFFYRFSDKVPFAVTCFQSQVAPPPTCGRSENMLHPPYVRTSHTVRKSALLSALHSYVNLRLPDAKIE